MLKPEGIITDLDKEYSEVGKKLVSHIEKWIEKHSIANLQVSSTQKNQSMRRLMPNDIMSTSPSSTLSTHQITSFFLKENLQTRVSMEE